MTGIEKKPLEFTFDLHNIQFNHLGQFYLRIAVQSSFTRDYAGLGACRDGRPWQFEHEVTTDTVSQAENNAFHQFSDHKFSFFLPKGWW